MNTVVRIAKTELRTLFYSPIAWLLLIAFLLQAGSGYLNEIESMTSMQEMGGYNLLQLNDLTFRIFQRFFIGIMENLYLYIPLITMALLSRETSSGTIKLLYSSPIKVSHIVLGKYLSMLCFSGLMVASVAIFMVAGVFHIVSADVGMLLSATLGFWLLLCTYSAIGLFMSSLTTYQVIAAIASFAMIGLLSYIGTVWQRYDFVRDITYFLSLQGRTQNMLEGLISTKDVLYFLLVISLFLAFTYYQLKGSMESKPFAVKAARYAAIVVSVVAIGYVSSRPALVSYYDASASQRNTLTPNVQRIIKQMDAPIEVITYNNVMHYYATIGTPEQRNATLANWDNYLRFKPDMNFTFFQYYDTPLDHPEQAGMADDMVGKTLEQQAKQYARGMRMDMVQIKTPAQMRQVIDLRPELNRVVMQLKYKGRSTFLRFFDDQIVWPKETEVAAAYKRLLQAHLPNILFLTGNLQRSIDKRGNREYRALTNDKIFRYSLINQGFDAASLSLDTQNIPADVTALVLADPKTDLSPLALSKLKAFIGQGGNLLIAGEPGKQAMLNPLLQLLGVALMPGVLVQPSKDLTPDLVLPSITPSAAGFTTQLKETYKDSLKISMPGATGLAYSDTAGFAIIPLLMTDESKSWLKKGKLVSDSAQVVFNAQEGDLRRSLPTAIALSRTIRGKQQRIIVCGDADFMSSGELQRGDVQTGNFIFNMALFSWLAQGEFPIDTSRPKPKDNRVTLTLEKIDVLEIGFKWILPIMLGLMGAIILIRRKRK